MSWMSMIMGAAPFMVMIIVECVEVGLSTLSKAAMVKGMSNFVFIVYYNALGTLILLPVFLYNIFRGKGVRITFSLLYKFFLLGLIGICLLQICAYTGISYSSPTLAAAIGNLIPVFTFILAVILRMEKLDLRNLSSQAKCLGTIVAISGAMVVTLYKGPPLITQTPDASNKLLAMPVNWTLGGLLLAITSLLSSTGNILQTATARECPDELTLVFFYSLFGTLQSAAVSVFVESDPKKWILHHRIEIIAIIYAAVTTTVFRNTVITWCLREKGPVYVVSYKPLAIVVAMIMGLVFLGDNLYLGSVIGSVAVTAGFYSVIWGQAKEKDDLASGNVSKLESTGDLNVSLLKNTDDNTCGSA
ncbi:WAT1-related protein At5g40240-like [Chenopodium quinoa]|uniref:WAT1-related protein At5g40240-like n=1 Tax=Chenopodium quinoa TaxID=63459 RepID=UPI000B7922CA|nr:WAT1-related protein At5g40240-like [Chenopodium quinoa]